MILKYKYHSDSGLLEAYRSYTLAQNNSLSDTIVITSTASDAEKYNYCLEFICYNSKSIPKAQYISPILNYSDGISFVVPNNLTEFRGHVDMQLTGYDPDDNSIVFKSISKNCKAFDVEGSLCVLEKDLNDTPNVFTEVLKQLEELHNIHQDIIDEAMARFSQQILTMVEQYKWYRVRFYDYGKLLEERWIVGGSKLTSPQYELPAQCVIVGGWYNRATNSIWDMDVDTIQGDTDLYLNYMSSDLVIKNGSVIDFGRHLNSSTYVPEYYDGQKVTGAAKAPATPTHLHFGHNIENLDLILTSANVLGIYFPDNHEQMISDKGCLYIYNDMLTLVYSPKLYMEDTLIIKDGCDAINTLAINTDKGLKKLLLPSSLQYLFEFSIIDTGLEELRLPPNIVELNDRAVFNNSKLKTIVLEGDISSRIGDDTFINIDANGIVTRPKLLVYPQYYENYKARGLAYEIGVIGQEYFDGIYAPKGE